MPRTDNRNDVLYAQLQRRMIEHGDWNRLSSVLTERLNESGWLDEFRHRSKELARQDTMSAEAIMNELRPQAEALLPPQGKQSMMTMIRQCMDKQVEG